MGADIQQAETITFQDSWKDNIIKLKSPIRVLQMQRRAPLSSCICSRMSVVELINKTGLFQAKQQFSCTDTPTVSNNQVQPLNHLLLIKTCSNISD